MKWLRSRENQRSPATNDYQAYWSIINDPMQPPALIANCMRNIVEYFFNFVRRKDLNNVFQMPELQEVRFQAFCRFVNRESHSLSQNIVDMKAGMRPSSLAPHAHLPRKAPRAASDLPRKAPPPACRRGAREVARAVCMALHRESTLVD